MPYTVFIIEDDVRMREIIGDYFTAKGFVTETAANGAEALLKLKEKSYDIALLDVMMPHIDGFTVCREIRRKSDMPVVFLTARSREQDMLLGFEVGADDYITKPFSLPVLHAKVLSLLKRTRGEQERLRFGCLTILPQKRLVLVDECEVRLAPLEYSLLFYLVINKNIILSREQILSAVWDMDFEGEVRAVDTHIKKLRGALGSAAQHIKTFVKAGYMFSEVV